LSQSLSKGAAPVVRQAHHERSNFVAVRSPGIARRGVTALTANGAGGADYHETAG